MGRKLKTGYQEHFLINYLSYHSRAILSVISVTSVVKKFLGQMPDYFSRRPGGRLCFP